MRQETIVRDLYQFSELSEAAKEKARAWWREGMYNDTFEFDCVIEDAKQIGEIMGIDIDEVYWRGFSSQGDGACFEGSYAYKKGSVKALKEFAPLDKELIRIAETLQAIQKRAAYRIEASVESGRYSNSAFASISVEMRDVSYADVKEEKEIKELLKDFMDWIYKQLETQNDYINSNESIDDNIDANEYEFLENGKRA